MGPMKEVTIYTRGLSAPSGMGGYGVVLLCDGHRKELCGGFPNSSNNRMDILAAVEGLRALKFLCRVTLYNTNTYLTDAVSKDWIQRWKANGWRNAENKPTSHADLWEILLNLCAIHEVKFVWLPFDSANREYVRCDWLAREVVAGQSRDRVR